jgi:hypothetical protein
MNKSLLITIIVIVILGIGGVAAYALMSKPATKNTANPMLQQTSENVQSQPKSLRELMTSAQNQECSFTDTETGSNGNVYIGVGQVRGDFNSISNGSTVGSHIISTGEDVYVWMDGQQNGFKISLSALSNTGLQDASTKAVDPDKKVDYSCNSWTVDSSKFALPTIEFADYSSMLPSGLVQQPQTTGTQDAKAAQCAACNSLPESSKAQCLQALSCN